MKLPHGSENKRTRIEIRATAILYGIEWGTELDRDDINLDEDEEIEVARRLAARWAQ